MEVMEAIRKRRSIRRYKPDPVPAHMVDGILEAARLAPSTGNIQSWKFKVITDEKTRKELQRAAHGQKFVGKAPLIIACCADFSAFKELSQRSLELITKGSYRPSLGIILHYARKGNRDTEERQFIHAIMNVTIAVEQMILAATEMGLGTCWIRAFDAKEATSILDLPSEVMLLALLTVGYPDESPNPRPRKPLDEIKL